MAKVIAKTIEGNEYLYSKFASYKVAEKSAKAICKVLGKTLDEIFGEE